MLADQIGDLRRALTAAADPAKARPMAEYVKDNFPFLGVAAPRRRVAAKFLVDGGRDLDSSDLLDAADACWAQPEREFHYVGTDLLVRWVPAIDPSDLGRVERLIRTHSWWDTVDALAVDVVGPMATADDSIRGTIDVWIDDELWIARAAVLHQLKYRERTDADRLFGYIDRRAADPDFFMRKAAGWALREHAKTDPTAVRQYVIGRGDRLSALTRREALKHIGA